MKTFAQLRELSSLVSKSNCNKPKMVGRCSSAINATIAMKHASYSMVKYI